MSCTVRETIRNIVFRPGKAEISALPSKGLTKGKPDHCDCCHLLPSRSRYHLRTVAILGSDIEFLSVELDIKYVKPIIVTTIYRPPESKVEWFKRAEELSSRIAMEGKESISWRHEL